MLLEIKLTLYKSLLENAQEQVELTIVRRRQYQRRIDGILNRMFIIIGEDVEDIENTEKSEE